MATSLLAGNGYALPSGVTVIHRPPGYVAFILLTAPAMPHYSYLILHFLQGLLAGAATFVTYQAGRRLGLISSGALFAAWIVALWPFAIWESKVTVPENLLLLLVPMALFASSRVESSVGRAAGAGLITAAAALTHGLYQLLILPVLLMIASRSTGRLRARLSAAALLAFAIPVGLWIVRNDQHGYPKLSAGLGLHYFKGNYNVDELLAGRPYFRDTDIPATRYVDSMLLARGLPAIESDEQRSSVPENEYLDREAYRDVLRRPAHAFLKIVIETPLAWIHQQSAWRSAATALMLTPLFLLACRGLIRARSSLWPVAFAIAVLNIAAAAIFVQAIPMRYALPWIPLLAILAGSGFEPLVRLSAQSDHTKLRRGMTSATDVDTE